MSIRPFWVLICVTTCVVLSECVRLRVLWSRNQRHYEYSPVVSVCCPVLSYLLRRAIQLVSLMETLEFYSKHVDHTFDFREKENYDITSATTKESIALHKGTKITEINKNWSKKNAKTPETRKFWTRFNLERKKILTKSFYEKSIMSQENLRLYRQLSYLIVFSNDIN